MLVKKPFICVFIALSILNLSNAQPPNDSCDSRIDVSSLLPYSSNTTTVDATVTDTNLPSCGGVDRTDVALWYQVSVSERTIIQVRHAGIGSSFFADIAFYTGPSCSALTCVSGDTFLRGNSVQTLFAEPGITYYVRISGDEKPVSVNIDALSPPSNNACPVATVVTSSLLDETDTTLSFPSSESTNCGREEGARGVWYSLSAPDRDTVYRVQISTSFVSDVALFANADCENLICENLYDIVFNEDFTVTVAKGSAKQLLVSDWSPDRFGSATIDIELLNEVPNDECTEAIIVSSYPFSTTDDNTGAFPGFTDDGCNVAAGSRGLWYQLQMTEDAIFTLNMTDRDHSSGMALFFRSETGTCDNLACIQPAGSDPVYTTLVTERAVLASVVGDTFYVRALGENAEEYGSFTLNAEYLARPQNDVCSGATMLPDFPAASVTQGDTTAAYPSFSNTPCGVQDTERALWYSFVPAGTGTYKATIRSYNFEANLSLFSGSSCGDLTCLQSKRYMILLDFSYRDIVINWGAQEGTRYYFLVHGTDSFSDAGGYEFLIERVDVDVSPTPPSATPPTPNSPAAPPDDSSDACRSSRSFFRGNCK